MRKLFTILVAVLLTASVFAQSPEKMSYQAVISNASNNPVTSTAVGMQISVLQGSASGTAVYVETQNPTTNAKGLVSLEIGAGSVVSGTFATIDWANGPYFIKTETDPTGGTSYTITGTSQLLSVPYALHAKTAKSITGTITETDPIYGSSQAANITATDITNLSNLSGVNTGDQDLSTLATKTALGDSTALLRSHTPTVADGSETKVTAGPNVTVTGSGTTVSPYVVNAVVSMSQDQRDVLTPIAGLMVYNTTTNKPNYYNGTEWMNYDGTSAKTPAIGDTYQAIGDTYQGGIIAYILQSGDPGYDANVIHGIIAAPSDQSTGSIQWYNGSFTNTGATATAIGTGNANTNTIVTSQGAGGYAAKLCADLVLGGYSDWYLPSQDELNKLYLNKTAVGGFVASAYYWSSSEGSLDFAWAQGFGGGGQHFEDKRLTNYVRAVRAF